MDYGNGPSTIWIFRSIAISSGNAEHEIMPAIVVDQRETERHQLNQSALITVVGTPTQALHGEIRNISASGTQIWLDEPLPPASLVRIEYDDSLLLGEVIYCHEDDSGWLVGLRIEHGLFGLTALARTMQAF